MSSEFSSEQLEGVINPEVQKPYRLYHTNVDGGGFIDRFETLDLAKAEAERLQEESDSKGNYWYYRYHVYGPGIEEYHTFYNDALLGSARRELCEDY
jgi:hypothetical protein